MAVEKPLTLVGASSERAAPEIDIDACLVEIAALPRDILFDQNARYADLPVEYLNAMAQQRPEGNPRQHELNKSVGSIGLMNEVDIALVGPKTLADYIDFTNRIWGADRSIEDFVPMPIERLVYAIIIAGHSRTLTGKIEAARRRKAIEDQAILLSGVQGKPGNNVVQLGGQATALPSIKCKVHKIGDISQFLARQVAENIHSEPPKNRAARAHAEAFLWRREQDPTLTKTRFAREQGISEYNMHHALLYADLPVEVRLSTDFDEIPFSLAIEMSRHMPTLYDYYEHNTSFEDGMTDELKRELLDRIVVERLIALMSKFSGEHNGRVTRTIQYIRGEGRDMKEKLERQKAEASAKDLQLVAFDYREKPADIIARLRREIAQDLEYVVGNTAQRRNDLVERIIRLSGVEVQVSATADADVELRELLDQTPLIASK